MSKLRAVILGCGGIAGVHVNGLRESGFFEPEACWDRPEAAAAGAKFAAANGLMFHDSIDRMIDTVKPDLVINALPPAHHAIGLEKAAKTGARIVVEKPMANDFKSCQKIKSIAAAHGVSLDVSESSRFERVWAAFEKHRDIVGKPLRILQTNYRQYFTPNRSSWVSDPVECPGGMIMNVGVHRIAAMRIIAGCPETEVTASVGQSGPVPGDCAVLIKYESGCSGTLFMCGYHNCPPGFQKPDIIVTERGFVRCDGDSVIFSDSGGNESRLNPPEGMFKSAYSNFYKALGSGQAASYSADSAARDVAVIEAALLSSKEGRHVKISEITG